MNDIQHKLDPNLRYDKVISDEEFDEIIKELDNFKFKLNEEIKKEQVKYKVASCKDKISKTNSLF